MSDIFQNISDIFFERSFGGVLNADKHVASARLLMSVPVCLVFSSVLFFVVRRPGCVFSCFPVIFFACVYVFVFQGCAVREAGVLLVGGIKKFEKSHGKVWLFGLSVVLLHSLSGTKRRRKAEPRGREFNDRIT